MLREQAAEAPVDLQRARGRAAAVHLARRQRAAARPPRPARPAPRAQPSAAGRAHQPH